MEKEKIKVENDLDSKEFGVAQFTHVFIKDEADHFIDTDTADTFNPTAMRFEGTSDGVLEIELQKGTDNSKYQVRENCDPLIIKNEIDEYGFINENMENVSTSISSEQGFTKSWIKCEAVEVFMSENDLDNSGIAGITEEMIIKKEDHTIIKHDDSSPTTAKDKLFVCIDCNATFKRKIALDNHRIKKHPEYIESVSSKMHECTHCTYKTTIKDKFTRHMLKHPGANSSYKISVCIYCNRTFITKLSLDDHIIKIHPAHIASVSSKIHECKYCVFKTTSKGHLSKHMRKHPGAGGCQLKTCIHCNAMFKDKISLDEHIIKKHPEYIASVSSKIHECKYCVYKTTSKFHLGKHMGRHPEAEGSCQLETCIHCNATFKKKISLDDHIIKKHPKYIASVSSKIYECEFCAFKTAQKSQLTEHMLKHPGAEGACELKTCVHCNAPFKTKRDLDNHTVTEHFDFIAKVSSKIHECTYCPYKTTRKKYLTQHMLKHAG